VWLENQESKNPAREEQGAIVTRAAITPSNVRNPLAPKAYRLPKILVFINLLT
jgi:hypothetical protein